MSNFFSQLNGFNEKAISSLTSQEVETEELESFDYSEVDYTVSDESYAKASGSIFEQGSSYDVSGNFEEDNEDGFNFEG